MPVENLTKAQMKNDPVLIRRFSLNQQALQAQEYLSNEGVEAFIFMDATWSGGGETQQGIRLVVKSSDANQAFALLHEYDQQDEAVATIIEHKGDGRFYLQAAWFVSILFAFLLGSFLTDKTLDSTEMLVGCVCVVVAGYFFFAANMERKKRLTISS